MTAPAPHAAVEALAERFIALGLGEGGGFVLAQEALAVLAEHGYTVVPATCTETTAGLTGPSVLHRCVLGAHDGDEHQCECGMRWRPPTACPSAPETPGRRDATCGGTDTRTHK